MDKPGKKVIDYFQNKHVVITGGSSGIGLCTAELLRLCGAHLTILARTPEKLSQASEKLRRIEVDARITTLPLDVGDLDAVSNLSLEPPVDILINNAGVVMPGHFLDLSQAQFDNMMRINIMGAVALSRKVLPGMIERHMGHLAYVSSLGGLIGIFGYTAYAASKFALRGFAEALRCEMVPKGIRVSVCYPPDTKTPQLEFESKYKPEEAKAIAANAKAVTPEVVARKLLQGMAANRFHIVPGRSARFADISYRWTPGVVRSIFDGDVKKAIARSKTL